MTNMTASRIAQISHNAKLEKHQQFLLDIKKEAPELLKNILVAIEHAARAGHDQCRFGTFGVPSHLVSLCRQIEQHLQYGSIKEDLNALGFQLDQTTDKNFMSVVFVVTWGKPSQTPKAPEQFTWSGHVLALAFIGICAAAIIVLIVSNGFH
jgi:hypothetical protein